MTDPTAEFLSDLRLQLKTVPELPTSLVPPSLKAGYRCQRALVERLCKAHGSSSSIGYKVALTSATAQALVGYPAPVFGHMLSHSSTFGDTHLDRASFTTCIIEVEFAFRLRKDVPAGRYDRESIEPYIGAVMPSIEIVDHRFAALDRMTAPVLAADNAIHGGWIAGVERSDWRGFEFDSHAVRLLVNGEETLSGAGDRVLGHPLNVMAWLASELSDNELALKAGDYVTTGLATDGIYDAQQGDVLTADFGDLGAVTLTLD